MVSQLASAAFAVLLYSTRFAAASHNQQPHHDTTHTTLTQVHTKPQQNSKPSRNRAQKTRHGSTKKNTIFTNGTRSIGRFPRSNGTAKKKPFWSVPFPLDVFLVATGTEMGLPVRYVKCSIPLQSRPISKEPPPLHRTEPHFQKIVKSSSRIQVSGSGGG